MVLMLLVVACYTVCGLSDKYSVAKLKFDGNSFTFLMALPTAVLLLPLMPFSDMHLQLCWQSVLAAVLIMVSKLLEFKMSALVLTEMSAFELKAWLGLCLFASYATDIITATDTFSVLKLLAIVVTAAGLFMIARSEREHISYKKIAVPLFFYLLSKFGYGFIITASAPYISSYFALLFGLILLAAVLAPFVHPIRMIKDKPKGCAFVALTKIPNALGLVLENAVIATSMTNYSCIQPMIMVALFFIGLIRKESTKPLNIIGSIVCISGIAAFQIFGLI